MSRLLLVRHGATAWNADRRLQGQLDVPLSDVGRKQVAALAGIVGSYVPTRMITSPLSRAAESGTLLGFPAGSVDARWQEADLGTWTGRDSADLAASGDGAYRRWRSGEHTPPGGESFAELCNRVSDALDDLARVGGTSLVVTHGGPVRAVCTLLVGLVPAHLVPVSPGSLTVIDRPSQGPAVLRTYNHTPTAAIEDPPD